MFNRLRTIGIYFLADDGQTGKQIWWSDGTEAGTFRVTNFSHIIHFSNMSERHLPLLDGTLFFSGIRDAVDGGLWKISPGDTEPQLVFEFCVASTQCLPADLTPHQGAIYFTAPSAEWGQELWVSNGTAEGTTVVSDVVPAGSFLISRIEPADNQLFLVADDGIHGDELWTYDLDADADGLRDADELDRGTRVTDADTDDDGICDGAELGSGVGANCSALPVALQLTDPTRSDTDGDGLHDGIEQGMTQPTVDPDGAGPLSGTDLAFFQPDADPLTVTSPVETDTDSDGVADGIEDANRNGKIDFGESDPADSTSVAPLNEFKVPAIPQWMLPLLALGLLLAGFVLLKPATVRG